MPPSSIALQLGISLNRVIRYLTSDMSWEAVRDRELRQHHPLLPPEYELVVAGWVVDRDLQHLPTTTWNLQDFVWKVFYIDLTPSWISKFLKRSHLSYQLPSNSSVVEGFSETRQKVLLHFNDFYISYLVDDRVYRRSSSVE